MRFVIYRDNRGLWRFRLVGGNNKVVASGEGYASKKNVRLAIKRIIEDIRSYDTPIIEKK